MAASASLNLKKSPDRRARLTALAGISAATLLERFALNVANALFLDFTFQGIMKSYCESDEPDQTSPLSNATST